MTSPFATREYLCRGCGSTGQASIDPIEIVPFRFQVAIPYMTTEQARDCDYVTVLQAMYA